MSSLRGEEGLTETALIGRGRVRGRERKRGYGREEGRGREGKCRRRLEASCGSFLPGGGECRTSEDGERESERKGWRWGWKGEGEAGFGRFTARSSFSKKVQQRQRAVASPRSCDLDSDRGEVGEKGDSVGASSPERKMRGRATGERESERGRSCFAVRAAFVHSEGAKPVIRRMRGGFCNFYGANSKNYARTAAAATEMICRLIERFRGAFVNCRICEPFGQNQSHVKICLE